MTVQARRVMIVLAKVKYGNSPSVEYILRLLISVFRLSLYKYVDRDSNKCTIKQRIITATEAKGGTKCPMRL